MSLHESAVAHHRRLASQHIRLERCEEQRRLGDVLDSGELAVDRVLEHDVLDNILLRLAEDACLLGGLLVNKRAHEAVADHIGPEAMPGAFLDNGDVVAGRTVSRKLGAGGAIALRCRSCLAPWCDLAYIGVAAVIITLAPFSSIATFSFATL